MLEKDKMLQGELYDGGDPELVALRAKAKDLCFQFNHCLPSDKKKQCEILSELFNCDAHSINIEAPFFCDYGIHISLGENVFINHNCVFLDCASIKIGSNVFIAPNVGIYTASHPINPLERNRGDEFAKPITIKDNVWIGGGVQIIPGVTIGENCVIGTGSVVTKDIPANTIAVGNPCKPIRNIELRDISDYKKSATE